MGLISDRVGAHQPQRQLVLRDRQDGPAGEGPRQERCSAEGHGERDHERHQQASGRSTRPSVRSAPM